MLHYLTVISKHVFFIFIALVVFINPASAQLLQTVQITSSPNPLGSGARALGYADAFIAIADDATAASWNPGGLMQLELPEISIVYYFSQRTEDYSSASHPEASGANSFEATNLNYFSAAYPFVFKGKNMIVSINYQRLYDLEKQLIFNYDYAGDLGFGLTYDINSRINYEATGGIKALSPAFAMQVTPDISLGVAFNFWSDPLGGVNGWKDSYHSDASGTFVGNPIVMTADSANKYSSFEGFNFNLGMLWSLNELLTIGAVYKSGFTGEMNHHYKFDSVGTSMGTTLFTTNVETDEKVKLQLPTSYGVGVALRFSDEFTLAFDVYRTEWGEYTFRDSSGNETSPLSGAPKTEANIKPTTQLHVGAEYLYFGNSIIVPLRGGLFLDPEPGDGGRTENYYGFALGSGLVYKNYVFDVSYRYRKADGVSGDTVGIPNTTVDVRQQMIYFSLIYHFQ